MSEFLTFDFSSDIEIKISRNDLSLDSGVLQGNGYVREETK